MQCMMSAVVLPTVVGLAVLSVLVRAAELVFVVLKTPLTTQRPARGKWHSEWHQRVPRCPECCSSVAVMIWRTLVEANWKYQRVYRFQRSRRGYLGYSARFGG